MAKEMGRWRVVALLVGLLVGCDSGSDDAALDGAAGQDGGAGGQGGEGGADAGGADVGGADAGGADAGGQGGELPPPTVEVNPELTPLVPGMPAAEGDTRPLAVLKGPDGQTVELVERELIVMDAPEGTLDDFVARYEGSVLLEVDPRQYGVPGLARMALVRVDPMMMDPGEIAQDLRTGDPQATGAHQVSSESALRLLALAAHEAALGRPVGVNFVGRGEGFLERTTTEGPVGTGDANGGGTNGWSPNAFDWEYMQAGGPLDIGVTEAWRALALANRLNNKVKVAILDMGFAATHQDYPPGFTFISSLAFFPAAAVGDRTNWMGCGVGNPCLWHGTGAALTAFGRVDNGLGAAGSGAAVVEEGLLVLTPYDMFTGIAALTFSQGQGAKIASMSYSMPVPAAFVFVLGPFDATTNAMRAQGMLLIASAGNGAGVDVDAQDCFLGICWERTLIAPCESTGVTCVAATTNFDRSRVGYSNTGESIELWAPGSQWVSMRGVTDPDGTFNLVPVRDGSESTYYSGTSAAAPFVAGIAALVWAADPSQSPDQVERRLIDTGRRVDGVLAGKQVHAYGAVISALGGVPNEPPTVSITEPAPGARLSYGRPVRLRAEANDPDEPACCRFEWAADPGGPLGNTNPINPTFAAPGRYEVSVIARDSAGAAAQAAVVFEAVNDPPEATIDAQPRPIFPLQEVRVTGSATDFNEPDGRLDCGGLRWEALAAGDGVVSEGCEARFTFAAPGLRRIRLVAQDAFGAQQVAEADFQVEPQPVNFPPTPRILHPVAGGEIEWDVVTRLEGEAVDPEGDLPITYQWTATSYAADRTTIFAGPTDIGNTAVVPEWLPRSSRLHDLATCQANGQRLDLTLRATDRLGNTARTTLTLTYFCPPG